MNGKRFVKDAKRCSTSSHKYFKHVEGVRLNRESHKTNSFPQHNKYIFWDVWGYQKQINAIY